MSEGNSVCGGFVVDGFVTLPFSMIGGLSGNRVELWLCRNLLHEVLMIGAEHQQPNNQRRWWFRFWDRWSAPQRSSVAQRWCAIGSTLCTSFAGRLDLEATTFALPIRFTYIDVPAH